MASTTTQEQNGSDVTAKMPPSKMYTQPVPFERIPAAAGTLPSWEQKKLELGLSDLSTSDERPAAGSTNGIGAAVIANGHARSASNPNAPPSPTSASNKLQKASPGSGAAAPERPSFFNSLRSASSGSIRRKPNSDTKIIFHQTGGIENGSPKTASPAISNGAATQQRMPKKGNPLLRYIQKHFSASRTGTAGSNKSQNQQRGIGYTKASPAASPKKTRNNAFIDKMRAASGKVTDRINQQFSRFNSKTPKDELPKTWDDWRKAYARGNIDITDLPEAPARDEGSSDPSPFEAQSFPAPMPEDHRERQLAFNRLDIEGKRGVKPSQIAVKEGEEALPDTLESHPAFRNIVTQARDLFDSAISIITVFNENRQLFLAETGLGGMKEVPREVTFCSHAVLQKPPQPFILNDTHQDWRFAQSPLVLGYGCRAYYGVPLLAPDFSGKADPVPIGTLCIIDNKPREEFTTEQKAKMGDLALLAQKTIANWSRARLQARLDAMEASFQAWRKETNSLSGTQTTIGIQSRPNAYNSITSLEDGNASPSISDAARSFTSNGQTNSPAPTQALPPTPSANGHTNGSAGDDVLHITTPKASPALSQTGSAQGTTDSYYTAPMQPSNRQKVYDISTRLVANSLELSLVYILRLDFNKSSPLSDSGDSVKSLSLVSSHGLPSPEPAFDAVLHLKALRSEEGGLLYQNPNTDELVGGERLPTTEEVEYASALLVPVCENEKSGFVLAGFTDDPERVFERDDLLYLTTIASELAIYLTD